MINLYILPTCPYCKKVIDFLKTTDLNYNLFDINEEKNLTVLMEMGGKRQVPFLFDSEKNITMYESSDIIEFLKTY
jgi:glutaredoxin